MKIVVIVLVSLVVLFGVYYFYSVISGPKKKDYEFMTQPRVTTKPSIKALVVGFNGDADVVIKEAYGRLFKKYFSIKGLPKGKNQPHPIARYNDFDEMLNLKEDELKSVPWGGFVAIKVPETTQHITDEYVKLETVEYGKVAEIVHFGSYETEHDNINKLKAFIKESGFEINGKHEEEYIIGPGILYRSPKSYITIIRYQIK